MNKLLNFTNNFKFLCLLFMFVMMARPAYSIPTTIDEIKQVFGALCSDYGLEFFPPDPNAGKKRKKPHNFLEIEKEILPRLADQQRGLRLRALEPAPYTLLRPHETLRYPVSRLLLEKKKH